MSEHLEPIDPELAMLLDAERAASGPTRADVDRVFANVAVSAGFHLPAAGSMGGSGSATPDGTATATGAGGAAIGAGGSTAAVATASAWVGKAVGIAAVSFVVGGGVGGASVYVAMTSDRATESTTTFASAPRPIAAMATPPGAASPSVQTAPSVEPASSIGALTRVDSASPSRGVAPPIASATAGGASPASSPTRQVTARPESATSASRGPDGDRMLAEERSIVQGARMAILRGDSSSAMSLLDAHEARFPSGQLVEEREVLRVEALVRAGRIDDARARIAEFRRKHPESLFLPAIDASERALEPKRSIP